MISTVVLGIAAGKLLSHHVISSDEGARNPPSHCFQPTIWGISRQKTPRNDMPEPLRTYNHSSEIMVIAIVATIKLRKIPARK